MIISILALCATVSFFALCAITLLRAMLALLRAMPALRVLAFFLTKVSGHHHSFINLPRDGINLPSTTYQPPPCVKFGSTNCLRRQLHVPRSWLIVALLVHYAILPVDATHFHPTRIPAMTKSTSPSPGTASLQPLR